MVDRCVIAKVTIHYWKLESEVWWRRNRMCRFESLNFQQNDNFHPLSLWGQKLCTMMIFHFAYLQFSQVGRFYPVSTLGQKLCEIGKFSNQVPIVDVNWHLMSSFAIRVKFRIWGCVGATSHCRISKLIVSTQIFENLSRAVRKESNSKIMIFLDFFGFMQNVYAMC